MYVFLKKCLRKVKYIIKRSYTLIFDPIILDSIVLVVGQACNLKCVNCGNFCPISISDTKRYDIKDVINWCNILYKNVNKIKVLQIQGGEPFIYSDLIKLIEYFKNKRKINKVYIATNGTIIPNKDVIDALKNDKKFLIRISDYGLNEIPKELKEILDENGIDNYYYEFADGNGMWRDLGGVDLKPVSDIEKEKNFRNCAFNTCLTLENGEITYCSRATNAYKLQKFERNKRDYFVLDSSKNLKKELKNFVINRKAMEACRYCNGTYNSKEIKPAIQMK